MKQNFKQKLMAGLLSVCMMFQTVGIVPVYAAENVMDSGLPIGTSSVCTHHVHDENCGYTEGTPCTHEHTEECSAEVTKCVHEHTAECYPAQDSGEATGSEAKEPTACTHICDEASGCITKELACKHVHDDKCGYTEGTPCIFDTATCESCKAKNTVDNRATFAGEVYAVWDGSSKKFYAATAEAPSTATSEEILSTDKNTINHLYIMGESVRRSLMTSCTSLTSVEMPNVTTIDSGVFSGCTALASVTMPNVTTIGNQAFYGCTKLASAQLSKVSTIGDNAFSGCTVLTSVEMSSATDIGVSAFSGCTVLTSVEMSSATDIGVSAFSGCTSLASVAMPKAITIGLSAFEGCTSLASVEMPSATTIDMSAFNSCTALLSVTMPKVGTIGDCAFLGCIKLASVEMPSATSIGIRAFERCTALTTIEMPKATTIDYMAFYGCTTLTSINMPEAITIGEDAFRGCSVLTSAKMPNVTTIGKYAFGNCDKLESVEIPNVTEIGEKAFYLALKLTSLTLGATPPTVGTDAFARHATTTRNLIIQGNTANSEAVLVTYKAAADGDVNDNLWYDWTLPAAMVVTPSAGTLAVTTGNSNPTFGTDNAITLTATFDKAANMGKQKALAINEVEFKDATTSLGTATATKNANGKWVATLNVNTKDWALGAHTLTATFAGNHELLGASTTNEVTVTVNEVYAVYNGSKFWRATQADPSTATSEKITDKKTINNLYIMGESVPKGLMGDWQNPCPNLKTVICADTVTTIGTNAFQKCKNLASVAMPNVTTIGKSAFYYCESLASVAIPKVKAISASVFVNCKALASVDVSGATAIGDEAFSDCTSLASLAMPNATTIGKSAFSGCTSLTSVEMPKVTSIDPNAFYNCKSFASLILGATPPATVGTDAFYGCPTSTLTIQGNTAFKDTVLAAYKAAADGNVTDELWWGWALPTSLNGTGVSNSEGKLTAAGSVTVDYGTANTITFTASFAKLGENKLRTLAENQISLLKGETVVESKTATLTGGVYSATFTVNTKDFTAGNYNYTATFDGNRSLVGGTATDTVTVTINKIDQTALNIGGVPNKVTYGDSTFTLSTTGGSSTGDVTYAVTAGADVVSVTSAGEVTVLKAGTATITATKAGGTNYNDATATTTITVNAAVPTIAWADAAKTETLTYTGSVAWITKIPTVTLVNSEPFYGTIQYAYKETGLFTGYTDGLPTNAGEYTIKAKIAAEGNYTEAESTNTMALTINRADNSITNSSTTSMYYGESFHIEHSIVNKDTTQPTVTCEYKEKSAAENTYTTTLPTNAGNYTMRVSATATQNYNACSAEQNFEIKKAPLMVTGGTAEPKKWDGTKAATVTGLTFKNALTTTPLVGDEALAIGTDFTVTNAEYVDANVNTAIIKATVVLQNTTKANNFFLQQSDYIIEGSPIALADGPAAPTFSTMNDTMGTDTFTFNSTSSTVYQYSKDSSATWTDITASGATTAINVGNVALAAGALQVRVKATATHNASAVLTNTASQVFTVSIEGSVSLNKTTGVTYGDTITATVSGTQSDVVLKYQWKAGDENIGTNSTTLAIPGSAIGKVITVEVTATGYNGNLTTATSAVAKKAVTATAGIVSKVYDGTAAVEAADRTLTITKVNVGDDITITATNAVYNDANVNTNKAITLGALSISGTAAGWYDVTAPTTVTGEITAKELTDATVTVDGSYTYTGTAITPEAANVTVKDGATTLANGTDYDYAASDNTSAGTATVTVTLKGNYSGTASNTFTIAKADPIYTAPTGLTAKYGQTLSAVTLTTGFSWMNGTTNVGGVGTQTHKAKFTPADTANYNTIENLDVTVTVGKADAFALDSSAIMVKNQANYTVKLDMTKVSGYPAILGGTPAFAIASSTSNGLTSATMDADSKTLVLVANNTANSTADTVTVSVTGMGNYEESTITVAVSYTDKTPVTITGVTTQDGTYHGGAQKGYTGTPASAFTGSYDVTYTGREGTTYNSTNAPKIAGNYTVTISVPDSNVTYLGSTSLNFTISKASVTIKADNKSAYVGDTQPALTYTATGLATGESLHTVPTLTCTPDMSKAGSYEITASGAAVPNTDNYSSAITYTKGTLTVSTRPSSGGGTVTPPVPKPEPPKTDPGTGSTEVSVPVKPVTKGDTSSATVPETAVSDAIAAVEKEAAKTGGSASVTISVDAPEGAKTVETTLSGKSLSAVAEGKTEGLKISTPVADLSFDSEALKNIAGMAGKDVKISATQVDNKALTDAQKSQVGDAPVFDFTVTSGDKTISNFNGGTATVSVPYTLKEGENPEFVTVWLLDDAGKLIPIEAKYTDGKIAFETGHFSRYAIGYLPFTDVKADWAYESIVYAYQNQLFSGVGNDKFAPTDNMNRAMLWAVLYRMAGSPGKTETPANWYADAQAWAIANGISDGTNPDGNITREQLATILFRYAKAAATAADMSGFTDTNEISSFAKDGISWAVKSKILQGNCGKLEPQGNATRAEVAAVLSRYVELVIDKATA